MKKLINHKRKYQQKGVALLLALVFVTFFAAIVASIATSNNKETFSGEAETAGWQLVQLAKAARLFVRDDMAADAYVARQKAAHLYYVPIQTLKDAGYLPENFGRKVTGTYTYSASHIVGRDYSYLNGDRYLNALGQEMHVIVTLWSNKVGSFSPDQHDISNVPVAFAYFQNTSNSRSTPGLASKMAEAARTLGVPITATIFKDAVNISSLCKNQWASIIWDTGCLNTGAVAVLANHAGLTPNFFQPGEILMPSWKATQQDTRVVMRFPQPDNPGYSTMLTDLKMGQPVIENCPNTADQVSVNTTDSSGNSVSTPTGLCKTVSDSGAVDNRRDILNAAYLGAERVIAEPQSADFGVEIANIGTSNEEVLNVSGNLLLNNDLRVNNVLPLPGGITERLSIPNGTIAVDRNAYLYSQNSSYKGVVTIDNAVNADSIVTGDFSTGSLVSTSNGANGANASMSVTNQTTVNGKTLGNNTVQIISDTMTANSAKITASDNTGKVQITNTLDLSNSANLTVNGTQKIPGGDYTVISGNIDTVQDVIVTDNAQFLSSNGSLLVNTTKNTAGSSGSTKMPVLNTSDCLEGLNVSNACPNRQYSPPNITP
jgi:hypothetical protein